MQFGVVYNPPDVTPQASRTTMDQIDTWPRKSLFLRSMRISQAGAPQEAAAKDVMSRSIGIQHETPCTTRLPNGGGLAAVRESQVE
jgi:hypothetical protein